MRCPACKQYVPDGLGLKVCPSCNADLSAAVVSMAPQAIPVQESRDNKEPQLFSSNIYVKTVSVKALFVTFYLFLTANILVVLWEYVIKTGSHFKMDPFVARLEYRGSFHNIEILSPILFWLLTLIVVRVAYVLKSEKSIQKSEVFLAALHVCLSPLCYGFGQLFVPLYLIIRCDALKLKKYNTDAKGSAFTSSGLLILPLFAFLDYGHALVVAMTPSRGYVLFNEANMLSLLLFFRVYLLKLLIAFLMALFFCLKYLSLKKIASAVCSFLMLFILVFLHFQALPLYKKVSYNLIGSRFDKRDTATIVAGFSGYHALGREIALSYIQNNRMDEAIQMIKGKEKLSDEMLYGLFVILKESNRIDTITYWFDHLKNAIERRNFAALRLGVDVLNKVGTDEAKKILIELEGYAKSDPNFDFSLKLLEENRLGKSGELKKDSTLSKSKPADAPVEPVTKQEDEPNFISVNGKVIPNPKKQK